MFNPAFVVLIAFLVPSLEGKPQGFGYHSQQAYPVNNGQRNTIMYPPTNGYPVYPSYPPEYPVYPYPNQPNPVYPQPGYPHPVYPHPIYPNPIQPNPVYPNPIYPNPIYPNPIYPTPVNATPTNLTPNKKAQDQQKNPGSNAKPVAKNKPLTNNFHLEESSSFSFTSAKAGNIVHHYKSEDNHNTMESHSSFSVKSKGDQQKDPRENITVIVATPPRNPGISVLPVSPSIVIPQEPEASTNPNEGIEDTTTLDDGPSFGTNNSDQDKDENSGNISENNESSNKDDNKLENVSGVNESNEERTNNSENVPTPNESPEEDTSILWNNSEPKESLEKGLEVANNSGEQSNEDNSTNNENVSDF